MMEILAAIEASGFAMFVKESNTAYVATLAWHSIGMAFLVGISGATALRVLAFTPVVKTITQKYSSTWKMCCRAAFARLPCASPV